ncbi:hypothetical protein FA95DRAFT_1525584 [Auriscalpium vulgare]|uniref:Uncharacterized protein n=1 Tax=Auriscalpium vulgare TaxID=40419 RepID=A0ACB8RDN7_9AGAM|nr:hypothetical protein FA95DRAFT_1525584 [Auriscalpium vulgare]
MNSGLPPPNGGAKPRLNPLGALPRRWKTLLCLFALTTALCLLLVSFSQSAHGYDGEASGAAPSIDTSVPPDYRTYHLAEERLPQHSLGRLAPQGIHGKYLFMHNHVWGVGWGNILQELVLNAFLAYQSNRTFVFYNYTWSHDAVGEYNGKPIPARIPLSALLAGPLVGAPFPSPAAAHPPPAVSETFFRDVCVGRTVVLKTDSLGADMGSASVATVVHAWVDKFDVMDQPCIEFEQGSDQLFNTWMFGDASRMLDIWPALSKSPILTHFAWSPLIASALIANRARIHPAISQLPPPAHSMHLPDASDTPLPGLLALHIRRGDYIHHCMHFANWSSQYNAFNGFPGFPDRFTPPPGGGWGENTPENYALYKARCYPEVDAIVERVMAVRRVHSGGDARWGGWWMRRVGWRWAAPAESTPGDLDRVYVLTNAPKAWLDGLKAALRRAAPWAEITTARDLVLTHEQKYVAQAVDMLIAQRAEVFIGNGFSSLTSNVAMLRMARGFPPEKTHFW